MAREEKPSWRLISVLFSSRSLDQALASTLYHAACDLYRRDAPFTEVAGDLLSGRVVNLRKDVLLGSVGGPAFEAQVETAQGKTTVRYLVTREGLGPEGLDVPLRPEQRN